MDHEKRTSHDAAANRLHSYPPLKFVLLSGVLGLGTDHSLNGGEWFSRF